MSCCPQPYCCKCCIVNTFVLVRKCQIQNGAHHLPHSIFWGNHSLGEDRGQSQQPLLQGYLRAVSVLLKLRDVG